MLLVRCSGKHNGSRMLSWPEEETVLNNLFDVMSFSDGQTVECPG